MYWIFNVFLKKIFTRLYLHSYTNNRGFSKKTILKDISIHQTYAEDFAVETYFAWEKCMGEADFKCSLSIVSLSQTNIRGFCIETYLAWGERILNIRCQYLHLLRHHLQSFSHQLHSILKFEIMILKFLIHFQYYRADSGWLFVSFIKQQNEPNKHNGP